MKIIKYFFLLIVTVLVVNSCVENEYDMLDEAEPGFWLNLYTSSYVEATKDISTNTLTYDSVYASIQFDIPKLTRDFKTLELRKIIINPDGEEVESTVYASFTMADLPVDTTYLVSSTDELFSGLSFKPDSLKPEYTIDFKAFLTLQDGTELSFVTGYYSLVPVLNGFCPLPYLPTGNWLAKNNSSLYTSTVRVETPSPYQDIDDGRYWLSDFGLDWSNWSDFWYSLEFKIKCPIGNDPRYVIELMPGGNWDTGKEWTGIDRSGSEVTKNVRIMPYGYEDSKVVGYYDAYKMEITFENVSLVDTWWNSDNHTVDLTFKFIDN